MCCIFLSEIRAAHAFCMRRFFVCQWEDFMNGNNYLGTEKVGKLLRQFAIPCIFSLLISSLYNIVDQIFVGNGIGYLGNAATGVIFPITVVGWGLSLFFGDGAAAVLSVSLGRKETQNIHKSVANSVLCSFLAGLAILVIGYLGGDHLLRLIGAVSYTHLPPAAARQRARHSSQGRRRGSPSGKAQCSHNRDNHTS